jgi:hypothetical protein
MPRHAGHRGVSVGGARGCEAASVRVLLTLLALGLGPVVAPDRTSAQGIGVRGWVGTTVQAVELRPVARRPEGCTAGEACYLPLDKELSIAGTQDVSLTAWGFGVQGLSATLFLRGRAGLGSDFVWPRSEDHFDALLGYVQWMRSGWRVRLGRQEVRSGLGFSAFDGGAVSWRLRQLEVEGYGGRSLARALRDPANKALAGIDDFVPDESVYLFGGALHGRFRLASASLRYQRELLADRSGLASERASFDGSATLPLVRLSAGLDWDFGRQILGKGHVTAAAPIANGRWMLSASAKRYVPYFSMSTIWGFFEPVAYHEVMGRVGWSTTQALGLWVSGGWRRYGDTGTPVVLEPLRDTGWRAEAGGAWNLSSQWTLNGAYHLEWGPGGFLNSGDASVRWSPGPRFGVSVSGMSFQQIEQYRLGDGRAWGGGVSLDAEIVRRLSVVAGGSLIRHDSKGDGVESPWNQARAWTTLRLEVGRDAGRANATRMRR